MSFNTNIYQIPIQTVSLADKKKDKFQWAKDTAKAYIGLASFGGKEYTEMENLYRAVEGTLVDEDYRHVLNPYNAPAEFTSFPAKMRNMPLIQPVIQLYLGDILARFRIEQVIAVNSDVENELKTTLNIEIEKYYKQLFINNMNKLGIDTGVESKEIDIKQIVSDIVDTFDDKLSIQGQEILDYLYYNLDMDDITQLGAYSFLVTGCIDTFKESRMNDVYYENVDSRDMWYSNNNVIYGEDADACVRKLRVSKTQLLSKHYDEIGDDKEIIDKINTLCDSDSLRTFNATVYNDGKDFVVGGDKINSNEDDGNFIIGYHVQWKAKQKEGELTFIDKQGVISKTVVNDTYKFDTSKGDIDIIWYWTDEVWEDYVYGDNLHFKVGACPIQRNHLNDRSSAKLSYNRRRVTSKTTEIASIAKIGYPFQVLYNIAHYQFEKVMNKNKDKMMLMPLSLIPNKPGWDIDKFMYMADALSFMYFDDTKDNASAMVQAMKVVDMGLGSYMKEMYEVMQSIKAEFWDAVGMNRQRFGEINSSDGKATTEQALFRSALISSELFRQLDKFKEKEANGLMDVAKVAYMNGKKATYVTSDGYVKTVNIIGEDIVNTEYGVFAKNTDKEIRKVEAARSLALPMMQNAQEYGTVLETLDTDNFSKIKRYVKKIEKATKLYQSQQAEAERAIEEAKVATEKEIAFAKIEAEKYKADRLYDGMIDSATIKEEGAYDNRESEVAMSEKELAARTEEIKTKERMNKENNVTKEKVAKKKTTT